MPVKSWKKSCTCIWKSIRQGMEAGAAQGSESRWKGLLIWWDCCMFWRLNMFSNSNMGENRKVYGHTVMLLCKHPQAWVHTYAPGCGYGRVHIQMHAHLPSVAQTPWGWNRKATGMHTNHCSQVEREVDKGRRGNQTREHLRRKRKADVLVLPSPSSAKEKLVLFGILQFPHLLGKLNYQKTSPTLYLRLKESAYCFHGPNLQCSPVSLSFSVSLCNRIQAPGFYHLQWLRIVTMLEYPCEEKIFGLIWCYSLSATQIQMKSLKEVKAGLANDQTEGRPLALYPLY